MDTLVRSIVQEMWSLKGWGRCRGCQTSDPNIVLTNYNANHDCANNQIFRVS